MQKSNLKYLPVFTLFTLLVISVIAFAIADDELGNATHSKKSDAEKELKGLRLGQLGSLYNYENLSEGTKIKLLPTSLFIGDGFIIKSDSSAAYPIRLVITKGSIGVTNEQIKELREQYKNNKTEFNQALRELLNQSIGIVNGRLVIGQGSGQRHFILRVKETTNETAVFYVVPLPATREELQDLQNNSNASIGTLTTNRLKISRMEIWKDASLVLTEGPYTGTWSLTAYSFKHNLLTAKELSKGLAKKDELPGQKIGWFKKWFSRNKGED
ncbi:hypothetical protein HZA33_02010 [Candidatus Pacearchaeota archaeon]|nr:hypothetical protein [Candidatus Pacearchaeota archaeon]